MKVESNWIKTRYSFICEDEKDKKFLDNMNKYIDELEGENKKLRDYADNLDSENDNQAIEIEELKEENKKLKEENEVLKEYKLMYEWLVIN